MTDQKMMNPIARTSLHQELVGPIQQMIVHGALPPGSKVPEQRLCKEFGVSRTPMREALKVLAADGLITLEPNRGAWVTELTVQEIEEVFPVLGALEALSGELACRNISDTQLAEVRQWHEEMLRSYRDRDLDAYFDANQNIHAAILAAANNVTLSNGCRALSARMQRARYMANMSDERWASAVSEHEEIIIALEARDGAALAKILTRHMANKQASVVRWLQQTATTTG